jgi:hypothetical protein
VVLLWLGSDLGETYTRTEYTMEYVEGALTETEGSMEQGWHAGESSFMERFVSGYEEWSLTKRFLYLPIFGGIQYLTPFYFWNFKYEDPYDFPTKNMNFLWFLFIGPMIFFGLFAAGKRRAIAGSLFSVGMAGFLMYFVPAFIRAGTVPRYAIPFIVLIFPCAGWVMDTMKKDGEIKSWFLRFISFYYFIGLCAVVFYLTIKL